MCSGSDEDGSVVLAEDWAVTIMAFPGKTVNPAAEDVDFLSCGFFLCGAVSSAGHPGVHGKWFVHH